ncbi:MAG: response regulator transcription factor [Clostridiales bacterium]|nr:response regulator transcription factor [Clostridiales bacterium]
MFRIAICDDLAEDRAHLLEYIMQEKGDNEYTIYEYSSGMELLSAMESIQFHIIFLDIQMEGMDGNETARDIRKMDMCVVLVFYTGFAEPTPVTFEVQPYRYIMKNSPPESMAQYVHESLQKMYQDRKVPTLKANINKLNLYIKAEHILYIEKFKKTTRIHLADYAEKFYDIPRGEKGERPDLRLAEKLPDVYEKLKRHGFGWPHDSYVINFRYLSSCTARNFHLGDVKNDFLIARSKAKEFNALKMQFMQDEYAEGKMG